jgi:hypothetical protein
MNLAGVGVGTRVDPDARLEEGPRRVEPEDVAQDPSGLDNSDLLDEPPSSPTGGESYSLASSLTDITSHCGEGAGERQWRNAHAR